MRRVPRAERKRRQKALKVRMLIILKILNRSQQITHILIF